MSFAQERQEIEAGLDWTATPVQWENAELTVPDDEYIQVHLFPTRRYLQDVGGKTMGAGFAQVTVCVRANMGMARLEELAELARDKLQNKRLGVVQMRQVTRNLLASSPGWHKAAVTAYYEVQGAD
jgi:hypothetical protein